MVRTVGAVRRFHLKALSRHGPLIHLRIWIEAAGRQLWVGGGKAQKISFAHKQQRADISSASTSIVQEQA